MTHQPSTVISSANGHATPAPATARLTVIEQVYHQVAGEQPVVVETRFSRRLKADDQCYTRRLKVGQEWVPLDTGWLGSNVGVVVIQNDGGPRLQGQPTPLQTAQEAARLLEVGIAVDDTSGNLALAVCAIPPGEGLRLHPIDATALLLRCRCGETRYSISLFPK